MPARDLSINFPRACIQKKVSDWQRWQSMTLDTVKARTYTRVTPAPHRCNDCLVCFLRSPLFPIPTLMRWWNHGEKLLFAFGGWYKSPGSGNSPTTLT
ncbi:hypothetical protein BDP81DRAFT_152840 [Colletotrichum phormii]|uniref:Uncharacterized protein n=1 Tax=Colletotrichum phormii TaxID=359342 RepID=A0AAJ0E953_9PEZI|nr:uncharacterized protein BDP81DRAFT_152840 [Colletotrichum phormii]KAK1622395.1 hypothetical protein BDP81DRAFT_152840 [Colletotrichum phormii]